jgi:hypothetical protein
MKEEVELKSKLPNNKVELSEQIYFESFGVNALFQTNNRNLFNLIVGKLPIGWKENSMNKTDVVFSMFCGENNQFFINDELVSEGPSLESFYDYLEREIRITIGGKSPKYVFLHSSVIGIDGEAVLFPAKSFAGKTTLAKEFLKYGAEYYSDEYAIIDEKGLVYPYTKPLSLRGIIDDNTQVDIEVEEFGGKKAHKPIPIKMICLTEYQPSLIWKPEVLSDGKGILELLRHTLTTRENPKFTLKVLNLIAKRAIIAKSKRGDASEFAKTVINYLKSI